MWIAAVAVPIGLLAVPLWLAHLEERVIRSHGTPVFDPDGAAEPGPYAPLERPDHEAA
ncbi:hypothetical protein [Pseudonocardia sp.]|jgi:hypothetical protein|uniref:hypothetical protein n=1 Tax=Pseudonocardia sp. TaxID=60912 RepID=UPI0031FDC1D9